MTVYRVEPTDPDGLAKDGIGIRYNFMLVFIFLLKY